MIQPFQLPSFGAGAIPGPLVALLRRALERVVAFPTLNAAYGEALARSAELNFAERALETLGVHYQVNDDDLRSIPARGPLVVTANHPFGGLDGLVLLALLRRVRPDVKLLANYLLRCVPELRDCCFFVDPFGGRAGAARNLAAIKAAMRWVRDGGALGVFPAGEVASLSLARGCVTDPPWSGSIARMIERTRPTVVPIYFDGRNGGLFQLAGMIHPRLRTALLPRALLKMRGRGVRVEIGTPIPYARLSRLADPARVTDYLRVRTFILKGRATSLSATPVGQASSLSRLAAARGRSQLPARRVEFQPAAIVPAVPPSKIAAEFAALPADQHLAASGPIRVAYGSAGQLPNTLREIGRLREATFRLVGEGTGREIDLDRFDEHYLHLVVWNAEGEHIVGAYRMGQTDEILSRFGPRGLYTSTLFDFQPRLLDQLDPALELGRSFIVPEYQREYAPILLLWKGIGRFVAKSPRYRRLFGAVSISDDFQSMTRQLLMAFLKGHSLDQGLASLLRPRNPPKFPRFRDADPRSLATLVTDMADVEELVAEIESNRRGVPVLLRQYLKLNAKLLGFNIDPDFGDVLDGLVLVDLVAVERPMLDRYLGKQGAAGFLAFHER